MSASRVGFCARKGFKARGVPCATARRHAGIRGDRAAAMRAPARTRTCRERVDIRPNAPGGAPHCRESAHRQGRSALTPQLLMRISYGSTTWFVETLSAAKRSPLLPVYEVEAGRKNRAGQLVDGKCSGLLESRIHIQDGKNRSISFCARPPSAPPAWLTPPALAFLQCSAPLHRLGSPNSSSLTA